MAASDGPEEQERMCTVNIGQPCEYEEDRRHGNIVCIHCGFITKERFVDEGQEWRDFADSNKDSSRVIKGDRFSTELTTGISSGVYHSTVDHTDPSAGSRGAGSGGVIKTHRALGETAEVKNRRAVFEKMQQFGEMVGMSARLIDMAKELYTEFYKKKPKNARNCKNDPVVCALMYLACKREKMPRTFKETGTSEREIKDSYRAVLKLLPDSAPIPADATTAAGLAERVSNKLDVKTKIAMIAKEIATNAAPYVEGRTPAAVAATAVYLALKCDETSKITDKEIAAAADIAPATIKSVAHDLKPFLETIIPARAQVKPV